MWLLSTLVAVLSQSSPSPVVVAWHKSFSLTGRPEIRVNSDCRVYASDGRDIEAELYTDGTFSSEAVGSARALSMNN